MLSFLQTVTGNLIRVASFEILPVQWSAVGHWPKCTIYMSKWLEPNFTKLGCDRSINSVVIPAVLVFPEFLHTAVIRMYILGPQFFWGGNNCHGTPSLMNNTATTCVGEDLVKIFRLIAARWHRLTRSEAKSLHSAQLDHTMYPQKTKPTTF